MDTLDSRSLSYVDRFIQKLSKEGVVHYQLTGAAGCCIPLDKETAYKIVVKPGAGRPVPPSRRGGAGRAAKQHDVQVLRKGNTLIAEPGQLEIEAGDVVLWHTDDPLATGFVVRGEGDGESFDSSALSHEAVYTHAFGLEGEYEWVDAHKGRTSGTVIVRSPKGDDPEECKKWMGALGEGAVVLIEGDRVEPKRLEIVTGQTVFWAVQKAEGISITDARLVKR